MKEFANVKHKNIPFFIDEKEFIKLVDRVTESKYGKRTKITRIESENGFDEYYLSAKDGEIDIKATSGSAAASALNAYLRRYCNYFFGILTKNGSLPDTPPNTDEVMHEESVFHYRYMFNYCTYGYSYAFNTWNEWERVTDYLILSGYNLVLCPIASEAVWVELLSRFGYTEDEAASYVSSPVYMPWQWMMNLSGSDSFKSRTWYDEQIEIFKKFNKKLSSFGVGLMLPGYCGAVPDDFKTRFPEANIIDQGGWFGHSRPSILIPDESGLYGRVAREYYSIQRELLKCENVHYFSADPFHEGGSKEGIDLAEYAKATLSAMKEGDPDAVWSFQGWLDNPDRKIISALEATDVLVLNMLADRVPNGGDDFLFRPHLYCVINNFGGQQKCAGSAALTYTRAHKMGADASSPCVGIGLLPEGVECDEMLFDIISEVSVRGSLREVDDYLSEYAKARYGVLNEDILDALRLLFGDIYVKDYIGNTIESGLLSRPSPTACRVSTWSGTANLEANEKMNATLLKIIDLLLKNYEVCRESDGYVTDLVSLARQLVANVSWKYIYGLNSAFSKSDKAAFSGNSEKLLRLFDLQAALVDCDKNLNLGLYIDKAEKRGHNEAEKKQLRESALRLITTWCAEPSKLADYAAREYGDMLRYFYKPRWEKYINILSGCLDRGEPFVDYDHHGDEYEFVTSDAVFSKNISKSLKECVENIIKSVK